ncbi:histidine-type phosphatase [Roseateles sp. BYS87W]|uniref:Multiple inositol polyphosphate phosphatase 1 n=1 Tax=Pelomonas baiyunensis TaxID=3299026 RepID=A0ABW7H413_9BURK
MTRRWLPWWAIGLSLLAGAAQAGSDLGSKTPYRPQEPAAQYEAAPPGYTPVAVQLVARHGSRGLTKAGSDEAALAVWRQAEAAGALTPLGRRFGADLQRFIAAQRQLGYGNLSQLGVQEHEALAQRLVARLPGLFAAQPAVELLSSGVDRAVDSSRSFAAALQQAAPRAQVPASWGADRFLLYFHRLDARRDLAETPARRATLQRSEAYQAWLRSPLLSEQQERIEADPQLPQAAQALLAGLYGAAFTARVADPVAAARHVMDVRGAMAGLTLEMGGEVAPFVPAAAAAVFMALDDAEDFYRKGPGLLEAGPVTYDIATQLLDDMLDRLPAGRGAALRFAHAEIIAPLVSAIGVASVHQPLTRSQPYSHANNPWRAKRVIPMAANVQWEVWEGPAGERLVRMLLNEAQADFKPACEAARLRPASHFYRVTALISCYRPAPGGSPRP